MASLWYSQLFRHRSWVYNVTWHSDSFAPYCRVRKGMIENSTKRTLLYWTSSTERNKHIERVWKIFHSFKHYMVLLSRAWWLWSWSHRSKAFEGIHKKALFLCNALLSIDVYIPYLSMKRKNCIHKTLLGTVLGEQWGQKKRRSRVGVLYTAGSRAAGNRMLTFV